MVGIYKCENGLQFTGIIADTVEDAKRYLGNKYGYMSEKFTGEFDENGNLKYKEVFVPYYNPQTFKIKELTKI